jgi:hypothetical protein
LTISMQPNGISPTMATQPVLAKSNHRGNVFHLSCPSYAGETGSNFNDFPV